jgi:TldD protein
VSNGQVQIGEGDFAFYVSQGKMIENGKLTAPIKDVNIIGNGPKMLRNITMLANDLEMSKGGAGACGKGGQAVPVGFGLPTCLVKSMTVGGVR